MKLSKEQIPVRCTIMRGGTSKAVFMRMGDVPGEPAARERFLLALFGSPDQRQIDGIIDTWADTSGMDTSIEAASDKGYLLKYLAPGMSANDIAQILGLHGGGTSGGSGEGNLLSLAEIERRAALKGQIEHLNHLIGVLERFNGAHFVTVGEDSVTTGTGAKLTETLSDPNPATLERSPYVFVPINAGQLALLEQSYAQLKQSVYDGMVMQKWGSEKQTNESANDGINWRSVA